MTETIMTHSFRREASIRRSLNRNEPELSVVNGGMIRIAEWKFSFCDDRGKRIKFKLEAMQKVDIPASENDGFTPLDVHKECTIWKQCGKYAWESFSVEAFCRTWNLRPVFFRAWFGRLEDETRFQKVDLRKATRLRHDAHKSFAEMMCL